MCRVTLASTMGTTASDGTSGTSANKVLNSYLNPKGYQINTRSAQDPAKLMSMVKYDVGTLHRAPYIGVWMEDLPWNKDKVTGNDIGHGIAVYGYDTSKGTITVYDPVEGDRRPAHADREATRRGLPAQRRPALHHPQLTGPIGAN